MPFSLALIRPAAPGPMWHSTQATLECGERFQASHSGCIGWWQAVPQNCGESMCSMAFCPAKAKTPMLASVMMATKTIRLRAERSLKAAVNAACRLSLGTSAPRRRSTARPMGMSASPIPSKTGSAMTTTRLPYGLAWGAASPTTTSESVANPVMVAMVEPSSVIQLAHRRGSKVEKRKRHPPPRQPDFGSLQSAHVLDQRVDRRRIQLVLEAIHHGVALALGAVGDRRLDLVVGLALLVRRRGHVGDAHLLALV